VSALAQRGRAERPLWRRQFAPLYDRSWAGWSRSRDAGDAAPACGGPVRLAQWLMDELGLSERETLRTLKRLGLGVRDAWAALREARSLREAQSPRVLH
jgi:hypothetical protein